MGWKNEGPSDAELLAAPESKQPSGDDIFTVSRVTDDAAGIETDYAVRVTFSEGMALRAVIVGEYPNWKRCIPSPRNGEVLELTKDEREVVEVEFSERCAEDGR